MRLPFTSFLLCVEVRHPFGAASRLRNLSIQACKKKNGATSCDQKKPAKRGKSPNFRAPACVDAVNSGTELVQARRANSKDD
jgi:hypothetical protein